MSIREFRTWSEKCPENWFFANPDKKAKPVTYPPSQAFPDEKVTPAEFIHGHLINSWYKIQSRNSYLIFSEFETEIVVLKWIRDEQGIHEAVGEFIVSSRKR